MKTITHYPRLIIVPEMVDLVYLVSSDTDIVGPAFCSLLLSLYKDISPAMQEEIVAKTACAPAAVKERRNVWCASISDILPKEIVADKILTGSSYVLTIHEGIGFCITVDDLPNGLVQLAFSVGATERSAPRAGRTLDDLLEIASSIHNSYKDGQYNHVVLTESYFFMKKTRDAINKKRDARPKLRVIRGDA